MPNFEGFMLLALPMLYCLYCPISLEQGRASALSLEHDWMRATDPQTSYRPVGAGHYVNQID
jgi:hypothetical protein